MTTKPIGTDADFAQWLAFDGWVFFTPSIGSRHFALPNGGVTTIRYNIDAVAANRQAVAIAAIELYDDALAALNLVQSSDANSEIVVDDNSSGGASSVNINVNNHVIGKSLVWVGDARHVGDNGTTGYTMEDYVHEFGHALGLFHAGPYNGVGVYDPDVGEGDNIWLNDSKDTMSAMSYFGVGPNLAPHTADILALNKLYQVSDLSGSASNVGYILEGQTDRVFYTVTNSGFGASLAGTVALKIDGVQDATQNVPTLAAGASFSGSFTKSFTTFGERDFTILVDASGTTVEISESNASANSHVNVVPHSGAYGVANMFDTEYYLWANPDVAAAGVNALFHWNAIGWTEGRDPNGQFDTTYYLTQNPDVDAANINPLAHYESNGWKEGRDPNAFFDLSNYLATNPDVAAAQVDPLRHFLGWGIHEGRELT